MKIAVVGCGAVGSFYGAKLWQSGHEVFFLLRSDYEVVKANGVRIESVNGTFIARPIAARLPSEIGQVDLVLVALKATANHKFGELIPPLVHQSTTVLTLQNGLGSDEQLAALFGADRVMAGHCFVCLNRISPGYVKHFAHGKVIMGEYSGMPTDRTYRVAEVFKKAGIEVEIADDVQKAHWEKLMWNIPFNGLGVAGIVGYEEFTGNVPKFDFEVLKRPCLTTKDLLGHDGWRRILRGLMEEIRAIAKAYGIQIEPGFVDEMFRLTEVMGPYRASTLLDFEKGLPMELEAMFLEPYRRAKKAGVETPLLQRLCEVLEALDTLRKRSSL